jgi:hypothetical protein
MDRLYRGYDRVDGLDRLAQQRLPDIRRKRKLMPIDRAFLNVFKRASKKLSFTSGPIADDAVSVLGPLIQAATARCVELNILANQTGRNSPPAFTLIPNLRGIAEDLNLFDIFGSANSE